MKATGEHALSIGWHAAMFARATKLSPLGEYLKPVVVDRRAKGSADVGAMLQRMAMKGSADGVR